MAPRAGQWAWFVALWAGGVAVLGLVAVLLRTLLR
jgi:hypothetical protein